MKINYDTLALILEELKKQNLTISTMESCTAGMISSTITDIPGASHVLKFSSVTYSNEFKIKMGVDPQIIDKKGVYSLDTSKSMAKSAATFAGSDIGVGVSGKLGTTDFFNHGNPDDENNIVYLSVYLSKSNLYHNKIIKLKTIDRHISKKEITNLFISLLKEIYLD